MDYFRKGLRKFLRIIAEQSLISPKNTARGHYFIEKLKWPDLKNPKNLNEKLMWMEFNTDSSTRTQLSDKLEVRKYVEEKGLKNILIPLLGVFNSEKDINISVLPKSFVIKSNNGCEQTLIIKDKSKINKVDLQNKLHKWLLRRFGKATGESHYIGINPKIIIEDLISEPGKNTLTDYKFMCFDGKVHSCLVCTDRDPETFSSKRILMDPLTWEELPDSINRSYKGQVSNLPRPKNLEEMVKIAAILSEGIPFVRVDLYNINGKIYFGELTFTPAGFHISSIKDSYLKEMGELIQLPLKMN